MVKSGGLKRLIVDGMKYGITSVVALVVDFGTLLVLNHVFNVNYLVAATIAFLLGLIVNYAMSHNRVFTDPVLKNKSTNFIAFGLIGVIGLFANDIIIWFAHDKVGLSVLFAKMVAVAVVFFWNFLARRQLLYRGHKYDNQNEGKPRAVKEVSKEQE